MKNLYTKSHFFGAIDNFCAPIFLFGIIFIIFGKLNHFGFVFNFFISGKIFFIGLFLALGSIASTHAICKVNFQTNQREQNKKTNDY